MLLCSGVADIAKTLAIAQSFWLVLAGKKNCGYTALLVIIEAHPCISCPCH